VTESDDYSRSVSGIDIEVVRSGPGTSPTEIRGAASPNWAGSSLHIGFPVFSRTTLSIDVIGVAVIEEAPPGMRWCGIDLDRGDILVYGPAADHIAVHPAGARFSYVVLSAEELSRTANNLDSTIALAPGSVERVPRSQASRRVGVLLPTVVRGEQALSAPVSATSGLVESTACLLATGLIDGGRPSRKLDDRLIVQACIGYAERVARIPTIAELCTAAHVSERRLHYAFIDTHDLPPHQFFITWALDIARRRLIASNPNGVTVAWIAMGAGFSHLGRFARYYRKAYRESPSDTLHRDLRVV
jgi:AraC-like DNA-binding protein